MKEYRIGEFARYLGVTPDLLKHYEDQGIIKPSRSEKGYRYYPFTTTMLLIECIRLRNYGMTLREIRDIVTAHKVDTETVDARLGANTDRLREEMLLDEALVEERERFLRWKEPLKERDNDWEIRWSRPMLFLPHTDRYDFLQDQRVYEILRDWMSYIPMVKSAMKNERDAQITWGLIIEEEMRERLALPVNDMVERIPPRKIFYYKFCGALRHSDVEKAAAPGHPAFERLHSLGLESDDVYYRTTLMPADWTKDIMYQYGYYAIPIKSEP